MSCSPELYSSTSPSLSTVQDSESSSYYKQRSFANDFTFSFSLLISQIVHSPAMKTAAIFVLVLAALPGFAHPITGSESEKHGSEYVPYFVW